MYSVREMKYCLLLLGGSFLAICGSGSVAAEVSVQETPIASGASKMLSKQEAIEAAQKEAQRVKFPTPAGSVDAREVWVVNFSGDRPPNSIGGGLVVQIDKESGRVLRATREQ